ncbi:MAG: peptide ABC transporter permease [Actinobacteria bacterium]|nr:peptide ABC transporter permease [Actinomycetota bacterium]
MYLATREMMRAKVRYGLLMAAIGLLVFLILFQQTLQSGLLDAFVGAVRSQSAPVLVFSVDGRRNFQGSVVTPPLEASIRRVDGVGRAGQIGVRNLPARAGGKLTQVALIGYEVEGLGSPGRLTAGRLPAATDEVVASDANRGDGFDIGQKVRIEPGGRELEVVGLAPDAQLLVTPTLYGSYDTLTEAVRAFNPSATDRPLSSAIGVGPAAGFAPSELASRINAANADADALTATDAAAATPGVFQVRQSFQIILLLYALVVPFVTGLFFLIITFQKANALTLLRAVGAPRCRLATALLVQVALVMLGGIALGTLLYAPLASQRLGGLVFHFQAGAVLFWSVLLLSLGLLSALLSVRRVLAIDPVGATTGAGVAR